jgi:hypothetical protein
MKSLPLTLKGYNQKYLAAQHLAVLGGSVALGLARVEKTEIDSDEVVRMARWIIPLNPLSINSRWCCWTLSPPVFSTLIV